MTATLQMVEFPTWTLPPFWVVARRIWPRHTRKNIEWAASVPSGTAKDWAEGRSSPRAEKLLEMAFRDPAAAAEFRAILDQLDQKRAEISAGLASLENSRPAVARAAMDGAKRVGARPRRGVQTAAAGVVK